MKLARVIERVLLLGRFSYTLREQKRERERQNIVLFPGDVTTFGLFHAHVWRMHLRTWRENGIFTYNVRF